MSTHLVAVAIKLLIAGLLALLMLEWRLHEGNSRFYRWFKHPKLVVYIRWASWILFAIWFFFDDVWENLMHSRLSESFLASGVSEGLFVSFVAIDLVLIFLTIYRRN